MCSEPPFKGGPNPLWQGGRCQTPFEMGVGDDWRDVSPEQGSNIVQTRHDVTHRSIHTTTPAVPVAQLASHVATLDKVSRQAGDPVVVPLVVAVQAQGFRQFPPLEVICLASPPRAQVVALLVALDLHRPVVAD